jgi:uncharacterized membrane protein
LSERSIRVALAAILVVAAALRFAWASNLALNGDESLTLLQAAGNAAAFAENPPSGITSFAALREYLRPPDGLQPARIVESLAEAGMHPPLHHLTLHALLQLGDRPQLWLRGFSLLCSLASLALLFGIGARLAGPRVGLLAAALLATSLFGVSNGVLARPYPLAMALALLSTRLTLDLTRADAWSLGNPRVWAYAAAATLGLYTTYQFGFVIAFQFFLALVAERSAARLRAMTGVGALVVAGFAPCVPLLVRQLTVMRASGDTFHFDEPVQPAVTAAILFSESFEPLSAAPLIWGGAALLALATGFGVVRFARGAPLARSFVLAFGAGLLFQLGVEYAVSVSTLSSSRFLFLVGPVAALFAAAGVAALPTRPLRVAVGAALVGALAIASSMAAGEPPLGREKWIPKFARAIDRNAPPRALVVINTRERRYLFPFLLQLRSEPDFGFLDPVDQGVFDPAWARYERVSLVTFDLRDREPETRVDAGERARLDAGFAAHGFARGRDVTSKRRGKPDYVLVAYERAPAPATPEEPH